MRVFTVKDETLSPDKVLAYLIYYENAKAFYIELPEDADEWEVPLLLSSFLKRGEYSIGSYWSKRWVEQRIVPPDRQNIAQILRENGLSEYDEFALLVLSEGRCAQDDCYLEELSLSDLPKELTDRWQTKVEDVIPLEDKRLLVFFRDGAVKVVAADAVCSKTPACLPFLREGIRYAGVEIQPDGYGVFWNEQAAVSDRELYQAGTDVPLSLQDFLGFVQHRIVNTAEACRLLDCSRQNIDDLVRRGKLHPIRTDAKQKLFLKSEVIQRRRL